MSSVKIPITNTDRFALIDADDLKRVARYSWHLRKSGSRRVLYAASRVEGRPMLLHRFILGSTSPEVDHANGDGLDCRKENLRPCTPSQNRCNSGRRADNSTGYKGVYKIKQPLKRPYHAYINVDGRRTSLGCYGTALEASRAYDTASKRLHGVYGKTNAR